MRQTVVNGPTLRPGHRTQLRRSQFVFCYVGLLPVVALFVFIRLVPICRAFALSLTDWNLAHKTYAFIGIKNYITMWGDPYFWASLSNTTVFSFSVVIVSVALALPLAIFLSSKLRLSSVYQAIYIVPYIMPLVPMSVAWKWIYDPQQGLLNYALSLLGIARVGWLVYPNTALLAIVIMSVWKVLGYNLVILIVGLKNIPETYYEAASIDGASSWQRFWRITIPLLRPMILLLLVISTINAYNVFTQVYVMTVGSQTAPTEAVRVLVLEIYNNAFRYNRLGYASAEAVILTLIVLVLTFIQFRLLPSRDTA